MSAFVAIDIETANPRLASICQIGLAHFVGGEPHEIWQTLVNPEDYFDGGNVHIHGIDEAAVRSAPIFPNIADELRARIADKIAVSHTAFDRVSLAQSLDRYQIAPINCAWLDTARVARRAWPQFARTGYGLGNIAKALGIDFQAHDAAEDARAAGLLFVRAMQETGLSPLEWLQRVRQPITPPPGKINLEANAEGHLYGEVAVFTGALTMPRREAMALAAQAGCQVADSVKKSITLLIVGDQDLDRLAGHEKSAKHRRAEALILEGRDIRILSERDFLQLVTPL